MCTIFSQFHLHPSLTTSLSTIHLNMIFPFSLTSKWSLFPWFLHQTVCNACLLRKIHVRLIPASNGLTWSCGRNCSLSPTINSPLLCVTCCLISILIGPLTYSVSQSLVTSSLHITHIPVPQHSSWTFRFLKMIPLYSQNVRNQLPKHHIPEGEKPQHTLAIYTSSFPILLQSILNNPLTLTILGSNSFISILLSALEMYALQRKIP